MKRLIILALLAAAIWYGWKNYPQLMHREDTNEAVIENRTDRAIKRVRLSIGDQTLVREVIPAGENAVLPFRTTRDAAFKLQWGWEGREGEIIWTGGFVAHGPVHSRHFFTIDEDGGVVWRQQVKK